MTEIGVTVFATTLLIVRAISMLLVIDVAIKQLDIWHMIRLMGVKEKAHIFRMLLFALAVVMILKNLVPLTVDLIALVSLGHTVLSFAEISDNLILQYFSSNALFDLIMSGIIWLLYKEAKKYN